MHHMLDKDDIGMNEALVDDMIDEVGEHKGNE